MPRSPLGSLTPRNRGGTLAGVRSRRFLGLVVTGAAIVLVGGVSRPEAASNATPKASCLGKRATIVGTARSETISGTRRADVIAGLGGNDAINGLGAADLLCGGPGADMLVGGAGADRLDGGPGFDVCRARERASACEETRPNAPTGPLKAGEYTTDAFRPRFAFRVGPDWQVRYTEATAHGLAKRLDPGGLTIEFDSFGASRSVAARIAQFGQVQGVDASAPVPATVGGADGQRIDLLVTASEDVAVPGLTDRYELEPSDRLRVYVVSVRGLSVAILVEAQAADFAAFFTEVEEVLASVKWS